MLPDVGLNIVKIDQPFKKVLAMQPLKTVICRKCKYYYITWDTGKPHGCRAMNFKSRQPPSLVVRRNSGAECMRYTPKDDASERDA